MNMDIKEFYYSCLKKKNKIFVPQPVFSRVRVVGKPKTFCTLNCILSMAGDFPWSVWCLRLNSQNCEINKWMNEGVNGKHRNKINQNKNMYGMLVTKKMFSNWDIYYGWCQKKHQNAFKKTVKSLTRKFLWVQEEQLPNQKQVGMAACDTHESRSLGWSLTWVQMLWPILGEHSWDTGEKKAWEELRVMEETEKKKSGFSL